MCGLAGVLVGRDYAPGELAGIADGMGFMLSHRGPDAGGVWASEEEGIALAHRRLAIIDLSTAGAQPMVSHCGRYVLAYNGEIFNFLELKSQVESARGKVGWRGHSDTEVLIEAIAEFGVSATVSLCNGMFAFALWDRRERLLILARDRMGKKPLYFGVVGRDFVFASEVASFRRHPDWRFSPNRTAICSFLRMGYVPEPLSAFEGIQKLESGTTLTLRSQDLLQRRLPIPQRYWEPSSLVRSRVESSPLQLEAVLRDAVSSRLVSDVPLGAFLSGGIDSTLVTALMKQLAGTVRTFTIGFDDSATSEARHASEVARFLGTTHEELILTPEYAADIVPKVVSAYDEPFADTSAVPTWLVSQLAAKDVKVVLSGDGADECFGGYTRYSQNARIWRLRKFIPGPFRALLEKALRSPLTDTTASRFSSIAWSLCSRDTIEFTQRRTSFFLDPVRVLPGVDEMVAPRLQLIAPVESVVRSMMLADMVTYLPDDILAKVDRASMAHGLEVRSPFLDDGVVEFAWSLPAESITGENAGKRLLREYLYRLVPRELVDRPKTGFGFPVEQWLRGRMSGWAASILFEYNWWDTVGCEIKEVRRIWKGLMDGQLRLGGGVWNLLMLAVWVHRQRQVGANVS